MRERRLRARLFETAQMRLPTATLSVSIGVLAVASIEEFRPYFAGIHRWQYTLAVVLAGLFLVVAVVQLLRDRTGASRFAALAALGGIVIAAAFVGAELFVGPPQRISAAPGQVYRPPRSSSVTLVFPAANETTLSPGAPVASITLMAGGRPSELAVDQARRIHSYVLQSFAWPAAYVSARSPGGKSETVTQPAGVSFVSPVLQFPLTDPSDGLPVDQFAVPALHREVGVKYYPNLPNRGIDIPFVQLAIKAENTDQPIFTGVSVNGRPLAKAGVKLTFALGRYPVVLMAGAPDRVLYDCGSGLIAVGLLGSMFSLARKKE